MRGSDHERLNRETRFGHVRREVPERRAFRRVPVTVATSSTYSLQAFIVSISRLNPCLRAVLVQRFTLSRPQHALWTPLPQTRSSSASVPPNAHAIPHHSGLPPQAPPPIPLTVLPTVSTRTRACTPQTETATVVMQHPSLRSNPAYLALSLSTSSFAKSPTLSTIISATGPQIRVVQSRWRQR